MHGLCTNSASGSTTSDQFSRLILPEPLEPLRGEIGIAHRVRDGEPINQVPEVDLEEAIFTFYELPPPE
jgi:hypothetical protein